MSKKILFLTGSLYGGGAERVLSLIANYVAEKTDYCVKICAVWHNKVDYPINDDIEYEYVGSQRNSVYFQTKNIFKAINKFKPDIIISFGYSINMSAIIANFILRKKIIISERSDPYSNITSSMKIILRKILYRYAHVLIAQTNAAKEYFSKKIQKKTIVIYNPIKQISLQREYKKIKNEVVSFGRLEKQKNIILLLKAFAIFIKNYSDYKLLIYGDGSEKDYLVNYVTTNNLDDHVKFLGYTENIHEKIINSSMYVNSSNFEGISNSMLEALSLGLPTIATDCPIYGAREFIENEVNGILVPVNDAYSMRTAMEKIASDHLFALKLSKNSKSINSALDVSYIGKKWLDLINQNLGEG